MIRAIHVDKDGTFSLSEPRNKRIIEDLAAKEGIYPDMTPEDRHTLWKKHLWGMCEGQAEQSIHAILITEFPESSIASISPEKFEIACKTLYDERHHEVTIRDGIIEELSAYKDKGVMLSMVTSSDLKSTDMDLALAFGTAAIGHEFFDSVITSDDIPDPLHRKPSPIPFLKSCHSLNISVDFGNVVLEDSPTGSDAALSCFGNGNNLVVRFLEDDGQGIVEHDHDRLVHAYNMEDASRMIRDFHNSILSDRRLNDNVPVEPFVERGHDEIFQQPRQHGIK